MKTYEDLVRELSETVPMEEQTTRSFPVEQRKQATARLTELMRTIRPFSFLRLGDMELGLMLMAQTGADAGWTENDANEQMSSTARFAHPGLTMSYVERLRKSYENATYVDFHERWWINKGLNPLLQLDRPADALRNNSDAASHIFMDWLRYEFKGYTKGRRVLFAGGEAGMLQALWCRDAFRTAGASFIDFSCEAFFEPDTGAIGDRLDEIKDRLYKRIVDDKIDTMFLSLGGAAKTVCAEIAGEKDVCCFDFGQG